VPEVPVLRLGRLRGAMMRVLYRVLYAILSGFAIHEGGHYCAALGFGKRLKFSFAWGYIWKIPIPRWVWAMPYLADPWKRKVIALAGFGAEFLAAPIFYALTADFWIWYLAFAVMHLALYRFYAGEDSDFRWV
jgi:hypothetical protein